MRFFLPLSLLFASVSAQAYVPPAFFIYSKITNQREQSTQPAVVLNISKPAPGGTEELLGSVTLPSWSQEDGGWPVLSLLFASRAEDLITAVAKFGIPVALEENLLRMGKDQIAAMKEPPKPFYKLDATMSLKRSRQSYAWVHSKPEEPTRSIWIEKDTFLPIKISAPCPEEVPDLGWAKSGDDLCEVEFRNTSGLLRGRTQGAKLILSKDGQPLLYYSFEQVVFPAAGQKPPLEASESRISDELRSINSAILH